MGGIVQLRGLFAARETQVLAQSFSARFPFPTRIVEQLAYGKDLKGGAVPGIAQVPGIIAFAGGLSTQSARPNPAFPLHLESSQASNAKCLTSMFYCEASEGFRRFALLCVDSIYFGAVKRHWHCMCLHRKIFVHPFGLIRWPFNFYIRHSFYHRYTCLRHLITSFASLPATNGRTDCCEGGLGGALLTRSKSIFC